MNICDDNWAVAHLISLPDDELDQSGKQVARSLAVSKLRTGQVILAMEQTGLPGRLGYKNALHYFKLAGTRYVEARECRRVAKGCEELPILRQAAEAGRVGWTQLREVVRVASPQTEADWVEKCREHTSKQIHEMVKASKGGKIPPVSKPTDGPVQLRMTLSAGMKVLLERVASGQVGRCRCGRWWSACWLSISRATRFLGRKVGTGCSRRPGRRWPRRRSLVLAGPPGSSSNLRVTSPSAS